MSPPALRSCKGNERQKFQNTRRTAKLLLGNDGYRTKKESKRAPEDSHPRGQGAVDKARQARRQVRVRLRQGDSGASNAYRRNGLNCGLLTSGTRSFSVQAEGWGKLSYAYLGVYWHPGLYPLNVKSNPSNDTAQNIPSENESTPIWEPLVSGRDSANGDLRNESATTRRADFAKLLDVS